MLARYARTLSADELIRVGRFVHEEDRDRFVAARGFLRAVLGAYVGRAPAAIRFVYGQHGKPALAGAAPAPAFNLSHSGDWVLCAVAPARAVGVDVERVQSGFLIDELAGVLSRDERRGLDLLTGDERVHSFFETWTRKEAVAKAIGTGVTVPLDRFEVGVGSANRATELAPTCVVGPWRVVRADPAPGYAGSVAIDEGDWGIRYWDGPPAGGGSAGPPVHDSRRSGQRSVSTEATVGMPLPFGTDLHR